MNASTFALIIGCNFLIWRKTRQCLLPEQQKSVTVSRQVGRVLLIQALLPLALQTLPSIILTLSIELGHALSVQSSFLFAQTWTSCIYPLATMACIGHYRRQIKKIISWGNTSIYPST
jgi:hypothetical protein